MVRFSLVALLTFVCLSPTTQGQEKLQILQNGGECCFVQVADGEMFKAGTTEKIETQNGAVLHTVLPGRGECENFFDMGELGLHYVSLNLKTNGISEGATGKPFTKIGTGKMYHVVYSTNLKRSRFLDIRRPKINFGHRFFLKTTLAPVRLEHFQFPRILYPHGYIQGAPKSRRFIGPLYQSIIE